MIVCISSLPIMHTLLTRTSFKDRGLVNTT